ncbi:MAG: hypothetical protein JXR46_10725 [Calditrichaceae bacterium]|nr:hypothetical protein [Calditrichaceae bacterium]
MKNEPARILLFISIMSLIGFNEKCYAKNPIETGDTLKTNANVIVDDDHVAKTVAYNPQDFEAYIHAGIGGHLFVISSDDIEELMDPFEIGSVGFGLSYFGHIGYRNLLQIEYRSGKDKNNIFHDEPDPFSMKINRIKIAMKQKYNAWLFKLNPLYPVVSNRSLAFFIIYGTGSAVYVDDNNDGFKDGDLTIIGGEFSWITKFGSFGFSVESQNIEYKSIDLLGITLLPDKSIALSDLQIKVHLALGFGI